MFSAFTIVSLWVVACTVGYCFPSYKVGSSGQVADDVDDSFVTTAMYLGQGNND